MNKIFKNHEPLLNPKHKIMLNTMENEANYL